MGEDKNTETRLKRWWCTWGNDTSPLLSASEVWCRCWVGFSWRHQTAVPRAPQTHLPAAARAGCPHLSTPSQPSQWPPHSGADNSRSPVAGQTDPFTYHVKPTSFLQVFPSLNISKEKKPNTTHLKNANRMKTPRVNSQGFYANARVIDSIKTKGKSLGQICKWCK